MMASPPQSGSDSSPLYVERVRVCNFRGIREVEIELEPNLTVLVGHNNAGKSRLLSAMHLALGGRPAELDDFTVGVEADPSIDIILAPAPPDKIDGEEEFPTAVARRLVDPQTISDSPLRERFGWRTHVRRSAEGFGARAESKQLTFDSAAGQWVERTDAPDLSHPQRTLVAADLVDTGRDLMQELSRRGSSVRRVLSDLEIDPSTRGDLEARLTDLGKAIVSGSGTLASIESALTQLDSLVGNMGAPEMNPLPISLEELSRSVSIDLDSGSGALPIRMHGAGSRSLASLQVQGVLYDKRLGHDGPSLRPFPVTLVEEPEAHLHPQASVELAPLLCSLRGQKIVSTHSPHLVTAVEPRAIRLLRRQAGSLRVVDLGPSAKPSDVTHRAFRPSTHTEEMEKLKRLVERPFGEMLFSDALVLGDGATERAFLPPVLKHALGRRAHAVCVVDTGSLNGDLGNAAAKFAVLTASPWFIFADSDDAGQKGAADIARSNGDHNLERIVWIGGTDEKGAPLKGNIETLLHDFDPELCRDACTQVRPDLPSTMPTRRMMNKLKGAAGASMGHLLVERHGDWKTWPAPLVKLIELLSKEL